MAVASLVAGLLFLQEGSGFAPSKRVLASAHLPVRDRRSWHATNTDIDVEVVDADVPGLAAGDDEDVPETLEAVVATKPLGIVLESNAEGEAAGVFCAEVPRDSAAYKAGARGGDLVVAIQGADATVMTLEQALAEVAAAAAPVALGLERYPDAGFVLGEEGRGDAERERELQRLLAGQGSSDRSKVRMAPRRLPSARKLARASTNLRFWQDPLMIGSAIFTVAAPLAVLLAAQK